MKLRIYLLEKNKNKPKRLHIWDGEKFSTTDHNPVALCDYLLYPRDPGSFVIANVLSEVPICKNCQKIVKDEACWWCTSQDLGWENPMGGPFTTTLVCYTCGRVQE